MQKEYKPRHDWLRIVQEIDTSPYYQMFYAQTRTHHGEWDG